MRRVTPILLAAASIVAVAVAVFVPRAKPPALAATRSPVQVVNSVTGRQIPGARLSPPQLSHGPALVRVTAPGYEERTVALAPGQQAVVPLLKKSRDSVSLMFGGDTMMGRRFYEPVDGSKPLLTPGAGVAAHARLLQQIAPLLHNADVTVVNLESPLVENPIVPPDRKGFLHKAFVFASSTALAEALKQSGVEVAGLANNHIYDAGRRGVKSTLSALDKAGVAHFGAGLDEAQAWQPAYVHVRGQTVAFIGCATVNIAYKAAADEGDITPDQADKAAHFAGPHKAGTAACERGPLAAAVRRARQRADVVAVVIHGGVENQRTQPPRVRFPARVAAQAGATVVVGGHPHVVGGITTIGKVPWVESTGNLVFDQKLWITTFSYLTRFDINAGSVVRTSVDPFVLRNYVPVPVVGTVADAVSRIAAGTVSGPAVLGDGTAAAPGTPGAVGHVEISRRNGPVVGLPPGAVLPTTTGGGTDLLYGTGTFERFTTGNRSPGVKWTFSGGSRPSHHAACDGSYGAELLRGTASRENAAISPDFRVPVPAGGHLSLVASVKAASPGATLNLLWYHSFSGGSRSKSTLAIPPARSTSGCHQVRLNVTVPRGAVAALPIVRLAASHSVTTSARLWVDDVRLVDWDVPADHPGLADVVDLGKVKAPLTLARSRMR